MPDRAAAGPLTHDQSVLDSLSSHIAVIDGDGRITSVNRAWRDFALANGVDDPDRVGPGSNYLTVCGNLEDPDRYARAAHRGIGGVIAGDADYYELEYPCFSPTEPRWFLLQVTRCTLAGTDHAVVAHVNITRRKLTELNQSDRLRRLAASLVDADEAARRQVADDLHDHLQQLLVASRMSVGRLSHAKAPIADDDLRTTLTGLDKLLHDALGFTRTLVSELSPTVLYMHGLAPALRQLARTMGERFAGNVEYTGPEALDGLTESGNAFVYRSTRELVFNAVKHAGADRITIHAEHDAQTLNVTVADDGRGFDLAAVESSEHGSGMGLFSIQEHARLHSGSLDVDTAPGRGARFTLTIPLQG